MSDIIIRSFFENKVKTYATSKSFQVAYEGVPFTKPDGTWIECRMMPSPVYNRNCAANRKIFQGFFQINIYVKDGGGSRAIETIADEISALFPIVPKQVVSIEQFPNTMPALTDGIWRVKPIRINYRYESLN